MARYWESRQTFAQPSAEELRAKAYASSEKARKKGRLYEPVIPVKKRGDICTTWWGQAWCENLERYADYESRLDRGKRYVRTGTVIDLQIDKGKVEARVQGSRKTPYKVQIRISPLKEEKCEAIISRCSERIRNLEDLASGKFPEELKEAFLSEDGLFPSPKEISFMCSCPDWAVMCKHVAAVMYGIGVRLDENPFYFFKMRSIDVDRLIAKTVDDKVESMLSHVDCHTDRIMNQSEITDLFGIL